MTYVVVGLAILAIIYAGTLFAYNKAYTARKTKIDDE